MFYTAAVVSCSLQCCSSCFGRPAIGDLTATSIACRQFFSRFLCLHNSRVVSLLYIYFLSTIQFAVVYPALPAFYRLHISSCRPTYPFQQSRRGQPRETMHVSSFGAAICVREGESGWRMGGKSNILRPGANNFPVNGDYFLLYESSLLAPEKFSRIQIDSSRETIRWRKMHSKQYEDVFHMRETSRGRCSRSQPPADTAGRDAKRERQKKPVRVIIACAAAATAKSSPT